MSAVKSPAETEAASSAGAPESLKPPVLPLVEIESLIAATHAIVADTEHIVVQTEQVVTQCEASASPASKVGATGGLLDDVTRSLTVVKAAVENAAREATPAQSSPSTPPPAA